jgi:hypothetical protein
MLKVWNHFFQGFSRFGFVFTYAPTLAQVGSSALLRMGTCARVGITKINKEASFNGTISAFVATLGSRFFI